VVERLHMDGVLSLVAVASCSCRALSFAIVSTLDIACRVRLSVPIQDVLRTNIIFKTFKLI
jgi:hypothetical protein